MLVGSQNPTGWTLSFAMCLGVPRSIPGVLLRPGNTQVHLSLRDGTDPLFFSGSGFRSHGNIRDKVVPPRCGVVATSEVFRRQAAES